MDPNASQVNQTTPPSGGGLNKLVTTLSIVAIILILGLGAYAYLGKNKTSPKQVSETKQKETAQKAVAAPSGPYVPTTAAEKKMAENLKKYGVVCRRFTDLTEALKTPDIACILDLSGQKLTTLPSNISKLTSLTELNLSNNNLTVFPATLLEIKTLISLDLSNNDISSIPNSIAIPQTIQSLKLTGNNLSTTDMTKYQRIPGTPAPLPSVSPTPVKK